VSRRQEKVNRTIRDTISEVLGSGLSDPRVQGLITVTHVETSADLRKAKVYLSVLGTDEKQQELSLRGIRHASGFVQGRLAKQLAMKSCPTLSFFLDDSLKKGFETMQILDRIALERGEQEGEGGSGEHEGRCELQE